MKALLVTLILLSNFSSLISQDLTQIKDPFMFERVAGFSLYDYSIINFGSYRFCDENGDNLIVEGTITYYYYEYDGEVDPMKIIEKFTGPINQIGGKVYGDKPNQKYIVYRDSAKLIWVDLFAEDFYYTLNIIEKYERISEITSEDLLGSLVDKGEATLYFNFDAGDCTIKEECKSVMEMIAGVMNNDKLLNIKVVGYTDNIGRIEDNKLLSSRRAEALCLKLIEQGIDESRLSWEGKGEVDPISDNSTAEGRSLNNRIVLIKK